MFFFIFFSLTKYYLFFFFFCSRRRHTRLTCDWSSDVCSSDLHPAGSGMYERFRDFLHAQGVERPRVKIMPVFGLGRQPAGATPPLTEEDLEGFDRSVLQCADARVVAAGGVYACPILAGLEG